VHPSCQTLGVASAKHGRGASTLPHTNSFRVVKFKTIPPDPAEIPRTRLVVPPSIPIVMFALAWWAESSGHVWNIHGDAMALLLLFAASLLFAVVSSLIVLASVVPALIRYPTLRAKPNLFAVAFSSVFVVAALCLVAYTVAKVAHA
jgi:hypothetical protein